MINDLQKASLMKRLSAFLLDFVLFTMLFSGVLLLTNSIFNFDYYLNRYLEERPNEIIAEYQEKYKDELAKIDDAYYLSYEDYFNISDDDFNALPQEVRSIYDKCYSETQEAIFTDAEMIKSLEILTNSALAMVSISFLIPYLILEFLVPLLFKNGQTLGKKVFSIAVMRNDGVKISPKLLFIRTVLGKFTVETMVPMFMILLFIIGLDPIVCITTILAILLIQLVLLITSRTRALIHDSLSSTVVVDFQSQMIFDSVEEKREYQLRLHKEAVDKAKY